MTVITSESRAGPFGHHPPPLDVSVRSEDPSALIIEVRGELDLHTGRILKQHLEVYNDPRANGNRPRRVIYLLPELGFMDASGLHALLDAVDGHGPETITIREPSSSVCRLLELVGMGSMIEQPANQ